MKFNKSILFLSTVLLLNCLFAEPYWIHFNDKGFEKASPREKVELDRAYKRLSSRCIQRRIKSTGDEFPVDYGDIDLNPDYIETLKSMKIKIRVKSRWLNAVSAEIDETQFESISELPFIESIVPVGRYFRVEPTAFAESDMEYHPFYGNSFTQNKMHNTPVLHRAGIDGSGVLICITDTGFMIEHETFSATDIIDSYDFVGDDSIVGYEPGDAYATESHGTKTLSTMAGYSPAELIGTAYNASYLLARTEDYDMEDPIEEDFWIAAAEWADSAGADIISTSLGYHDWYTADSMDGDTAPITITADRMSHLGICPVICSGNYGSSPSSLTAPGDGDSVITIGACATDSSIVGFSSRGPTADGRIKPDLCALGMRTACATNSSSASYGTASGTSLSTPLVAGLAALILQARPDLTSWQVRQALVNTASNRLTPNNDIGWGIPDISAALACPVDSACAIAIIRGWNLISIPIDSDFDVDDIFPHRIGSVWHWNPESTAYMETDLIEPGKGYFVLYDRDTVVYAEGPPLESLTIPVSSGWNCIGSPGKTNSHSNIMESSTVGIHNKFYIYDQIDKTYKNTNVTNPGAGIFILVIGPGGDIEITD